MDDYTDLIEYLREMHDVMLYDDSAESGISEEMITDIDAIACKEAADAIEQLVAECNRLQSVYDEIDKAHHDTFLMYCKMKHERDAAIADFTIYIKHMEYGRKAFSCEFCNEENCDDCKHCSNFEWRGVRSETDVR